MAGCWWCNFFGVICGGIHEALCCCSCWLCMPDEAKRIRRSDDCCIIGEYVGIGGNLCCYGSVCCSPDYLQQYSAQLSMKSAEMNVNGNQNQPPPGGYNQNQGGYNQGGYPQQQYNQGPMPPNYGRGNQPTTIVINT